MPRRSKQQHPNATARAGFLSLPGKGGQQWRLQRFRQPGCGFGLRVWTGSRRIPARTRLLAFVIVKSFDSLQAAAACISESDNEQLRVIRAGKRVHVYDISKSPAH